MYSSEAFRFHQIYQHALADSQSPWWNGRKERVVGVGAGSEKIKEFFNGDPPKMPTPRASQNARGRNCKKDEYP